MSMKTAKKTAKKTAIRLYGLNFVEIIKLVVICSMVAWIFYDSLWGIIPGIIFAIAIFILDEKRAREKYKKKTLEDFKQMITGLSAALEAGNSLDNAFIKVEKEMNRLLDRKSEINRLLREINKRKQMMIPVEETIIQFGIQEKIDEIRELGIVIRTIRKTGGDITKVIQSSVIRISEKIDTEIEIQVMVAAKNLESKIMVVMPAFVIAVLRFTNGEYLAVLYRNIYGAVFMTMALIIVYICILACEKITRIEV